MRTCHSPNDRQVPLTHTSPNTSNAPLLPRCETEFREATPLSAALEHVRAWYPKQTAAGLGSEYSVAILQRSCDSPPTPRCNGLRMPALVRILNARHAPTLWDGLEGRVPQRRGGVSAEPRTISRAAPPRTCPPGAPVRRQHLLRPRRVPSHGRANHAVSSPRPCATSCDMTLLPRFRVTPPRWERSWRTLFPAWGLAFPQYVHTLAHTRSARTMGLLNAARLTPRRDDVGCARIPALLEGRKTPESLTRTWFPPPCKTSGRSQRRPFSTPQLTKTGDLRKCARSTQRQARIQPAQWIPATPADQNGETARRAEDRSETAGKPSDQVRFPVRPG